MKFKDAQTIIKYINDEDYEPNDWESDFIDSILSSGDDLSPKQEQCLNNIYAKATGGGIYQSKEPK